MITTDHLLLALIKKDRVLFHFNLKNRIFANERAEVQDVIKKLGLNVRDLRTVILRSLRERRVTKKQALNLRDLKSVNGFGVSLTHKYLEKHRDPITGRDKEVQVVIEVLGRKQKNNPVLIGDPRIGKTSIADGLVQRIAEKAGSA